MDKNTKSVVSVLKSKYCKKNVDGMARFGITSKAKVLGISMPFIKSIAKQLGKDTAFAIKLWDTNIFEARMLAVFIANPADIKLSTISKWASEFDNWAICDGACIHCFRNTPYAHSLTLKWIKNKSEFTKRAGFALIATLAVADKLANDKVFENYLNHIIKYSNDERNFVCKAINWALRQIGKRNLQLNKKAIITAKKIVNQHKNSKSARWIANDALRELQNKKILAQIIKRDKN